MQGYKGIFSFPYSGQRDVRIHKGKVGQQEIQASIYNVCVCVHICTQREKRKGVVRHTQQIDGCKMETHSETFSTAVQSEDLKVGL